MNTWIYLAVYSWCMLVDSKKIDPKNVRDDVLRYIVCMFSCIQIYLGTHEKHIPNTPLWYEIELNVLIERVSPPPSHRPRRSRRRQARPRADRVGAHRQIAVVVRIGIVTSHKISRVRVRYNTGLKLNVRGEQLLLASASEKL